MSIIYEFIHLLFYVYYLNNNLVQLFFGVTNEKISPAQNQEVFQSKYEVS